MNRFKICGAALLPSVATMLFVQACSGSGDAMAQQATDPLEGVWEAVVTLRDCTTDATLGTFRGAQAVHRGGTLSDTPPRPVRLALDPASGPATATRAAKFATPPAP
jgi:hypothetical protein